MTLLRPLRIGTRQSPLALAQTQIIKQLLENAFPDIDKEFAIEIVSMKTTGDHILDRNLSDIGGKGLFTKELEEALLTQQIDMAVHSMKDMPAVYPSGLIVPCVIQREDPRDGLIGPYNTLDHIPHMAIIGTSSTRRAAQIKYLRPDLQIIPFRGNVATRIEKLSQGKADATLLAVAGLKRLQLQQHIAAIFDPQLMLPAVAQGAIGIQCREDDLVIKHLLNAINHLETFDCITAERALLAALDGSCKTPLAGLATLKNTTISMDGLIAAPDGSRVIRSQISGPRTEAISLGKRLAEQLLNQGGGDILNIVSN
ncbi:MAG: hydroxymethylbilane synthase [Alphaproteobacteria bacterium]|nr:hydroxymethylbilane synthase [Alphaproteobacteria bacterium]